MSSTIKECVISKGCYVFGINVLYFVVLPVLEPSASSGITYFVVDAARTKANLHAVSCNDLRNSALAASRPSKNTAWNERRIFLALAFSLSFALSLFPRCPVSPSSCLSLSPEKQLSASDALSWDHLAAPRIPLNLRYKHIQKKQPWKT